MIENALPRGDVVDQEGGGGGEQRGSPWVSRQTEVPSLHAPQTADSTLTGLHLENYAAGNRLPQLARRFVRNPFA